MKFFAYAALIASVTAIKIQAQEPWLKDSLPDCPDFTRTVMDDGKTHVVRYPHVGATCQGPMPPAPKGTKEAQAAPALAQISSSADPAPAAPPAAAAPASTEPPKPTVAPWVGLQHCPNMSERMTLVDGVTKAIPWPAKGANCHKEGPVTAQMQ